MLANHLQDPDVSDHQTGCTTTWEKESIMTPEQCVGKEDCYGCKDQLMIYNAIL